MINISLIRSMQMRPLVYSTRTFAPLALHSKQSGRK